MSEVNLKAKRYAESRFILHESENSKRVSRKQQLMDAYFNGYKDGQSELHAQLEQAEKLMKRALDCHYQSEFDWMRDMEAWLKGRGK